MKETFLGRHYDVNTATWRYSDGSGGALPDEIKLEMECRLSRDTWPCGNYCYVTQPLHEWKARQEKAAKS